MRIPFLPPDVTRGLKGDLLAAGGIALGIVAVNAAAFALQQEDNAPGRIATKTAGSAALYAYALSNRAPLWASDAALGAIAATMFDVVATLATAGTDYAGHYIHVPPL